MIILYKMKKNINKRILSKNGFMTTLQRSYTMAQIKSSDTVAEIMLRKALWKLGYRYTLKNKKIIGKPDIVLPKYKTVIFVDGDFWHGYKWSLRKPRLKNNKEYWIKKIEGNIRRDKINNITLKRQGWTVIRLWEHEVKQNISKCLTYIEQNISGKL